MTAAADGGPNDDSRSRWWPRHRRRACGRCALWFAPSRCAQVASGWLAERVAGRERKDETGSGGGTHLWPVEEPTLSQWRRLAIFG